jgi:hypothetical protein
MTVTELPTDLVAYLHDPSRWKLDAGAYGVITLIPLKKLKVETLEVTPNMSPFARDDPHSCDGGYYAVPAVNLVRGDKDWPEYHPRWLFLWLPHERRFGSFDHDHGDLMTFAPEVSWAQIAANAEKYAMASDTCGNDEVPMEYLRPWSRYPYVHPE